MIEPGASSETVAWMVAAATSGALFSFVAFWAKAQIERIGSNEDKAERNTERQVERDFGQVEAIAILKTKVEILYRDFAEERRRCGELTERVARAEAFQAWAEPLLEKAVDGLQKAVAFEARFEEQLVTLFKGQGALIARVERLLLAPTA